MINVAKVIVWDKHIISCFKHNILKNFFFETSYNLKCQFVSKVFSMYNTKIIWVSFVAVSYTHLDVYKRQLKNQGYTDVTKNDLIPLAAMNITEEYITSLKKAGLPELSLQDVIPLKALDCLLYTSRCV